MFNETSRGNVSFRSMPEGKRVSLRIGGIGLTIQQNTWNDLVRLAEDVGIVQTESQSDTIDNTENDDDDIIEEREQGTEND